MEAKGPVRQHCKDMQDDAPTPKRASVSVAPRFLLIAAFALRVLEATNPAVEVGAKVAQLPRVSSKANT